MSRSLLLLLFAGVLAWGAAGAWMLPLIDRDEPRFAEASREMLDRGDFVVPYFNNQPRFDKPPLIYWLQCAAYRLFGVNEFAARLPSALCAAVTAVVIAVWGSRLYDPATGWRAALIFGLSAQAWVHAHAAVADMAMIAASTAAAWAGWNWLVAPGARWRWGAAFWALLAVGFLAKGPISWVPIGMAAWTARKLGREQRPGPWAWAGGAIYMLALVGIWGIPALMRTGGEYAAVGLGKHVVMRSVEPMQGHGGAHWWDYSITFPFYLVTIWFSFSPWSFWLPRAVLGLWRRRRALRLDETYLAAGIVLVFGIFTLSWTKLPHYTLPSFPFLALLLAGWWRGLLARGALFRKIALATAVLGLAVALIAFPWAAPWFASQALYEKAAPSLTAPMELATVDYSEPSLVWLFRKKIRGYDTEIGAKEAAGWMARPGPRACVLPVARLAAAFPRPDPEWKTVEAEGFQVARGRLVSLAAVIKQ